MDSKLVLRDSGGSKASGLMSISTEAPVAQDAVSSTTTAGTASGVHVSLVPTTDRGAVVLSRGVLRDSTAFKRHVEWKDKFRNSSALWMRNKVEYFQGVPGSLGSYQ